MLERKREGWLEDSTVRYPTFTGDVVRAALLLLKKDCSGIFHCTGEDKLTKYLICKEIATILDKDMSHIAAVKDAPVPEAKRPHNSHLCMDKLYDLGFEKSLPFAKRVKQLLKYAALSGRIDV